jgi:putative Holliday junction resolvase
MVKYWIASSKKSLKSKASHRSNRFHGSSIPANFNPYGSGLHCAYLVYAFSTSEVTPNGASFRSDILALQRGRLLLLSEQSKRRPLMTRILGLDYGTARVGVAISDTLQMIASPLDYIPAKEQQACIAAIAELCREREVGRVVVGLPKHMNNTEGESSKAARAFGARIKAATGLSVDFFDERLTTAAAERVLIEADVSRKKRKEKIDSMAAGIILQNYLDAKGSSAIPEIPPMDEF